MPASSREPLKVYVGRDDRELAAYAVASATLRQHASVALSITPLDMYRLQAQGLLRRPWSTLQKGRSMLIGQNGMLRRVVTAAQRGQLWDDVSNAPMSTQFAASRFLVPFLAQTGWAAFLDCDVVALGDVAELFALADDDKAVMCVKHAAIMPASDLKMDGQLQVAYPCKNWSSVVLFNCDHPANRQLSLEEFNRRPGRDLHAFYWLDDSLIGELPATWNWLVNIHARPKAAKLAHFTLGGPWLPAWQRQPHDDVWLAAESSCRT